VDASHHCAVGLFTEANACACLSAAEASLPHTSSVTRLRNVYLGGLIGLNRFVRKHFSEMGSGWIVVVLGIGHASGNENISLYSLFMIHNDVIGHLIRHFSMDNHYKLS